LGPRVNAGGRVGDADLGVRLLTAEDPGEAAALAQRLDRLNEERRAIEAAMLEEAIGIVEAEAEPDAKLAFVAREGWHAGVIGIVASRLKERYNRPALVTAIGQDGLAKGSGRSVPGVDLGSAILAARQSGLLVNGGGHVMAAGFTARAEDLPALKTFLAERMARQVAEGGLVPTLGIDGVLQPGGATVELTQLLERVGPFGSGNAEPRFVLPAVRVAKADPVGENHVRCIVMGTDGARLKGIAFRALGTPLGQALIQARGAAIHLAGHLRADTWQGRDETQLYIEDAAPAA
jgi:single-stranded-DNA-specific exonuclease